MGRASKISSFLWGRKGRQELVAYETPTSSSIANAEDLRAPFNPERAKAERVLGRSGSTMHQSHPKQSGLAAALKSERDASNIPDPLKNVDTSAIGIASSTSGREFVVPVQPQTGVRHGASLAIVDPEALPSPPVYRPQRTATRTLNEDARSMRSDPDSLKARIRASHEAKPLFTRSKGQRKGDVTEVSRPAISSSTSLPIVHKVAPDSRQSAVDGSWRVPLKGDMTRFLPRPRTAGRDGSGPHKDSLISSSGITSAYSQVHRLEPLDDERPITAKKRPARTLTKARPPESAPRLPTRSDSAADTGINAKVHVRRPPPGIQHWFDALADDTESDLDLAETGGVVGFNTSIDRGVMIPINIEAYSVKGSDCGNGSRERFSNPPVAAKARDSENRHGSTIGWQHESVRSAMSEGTDASLVADSIFTSSNRQDSSVLSLSSSDEDDNDDAVFGQPKQEYLASTAQVRGGPQIVTVNSPTRPKRTPGARKRTSADLSAGLRGSEGATDVRHSARPGYPQHTQRQRTKMAYVRKSSFAREYDVGARSSNETLIGPNSTWNHPSLVAKPSLPDMYPARSEAAINIDKRRLMAVTEEEEALLEMMRRKRESMAKHSFVEGYRLATEQEKAPRQAKRRNGGAASARRRSPDLSSLQTNSLFPNSSGLYRSLTDSSGPSGGQALSKVRDEALVQHSSDAPPLPPTSFSLPRRRHPDTGEQPSMPDVGASSSSADFAPSTSTSTSSASRQRKDSATQPYPYNLTLSPVPSFGHIDGYPSPTTATFNSPRTPTFPASVSDGHIAVIGGEPTDPAMLFGNRFSAHHDRRRTASSSMIVLDAEEDSGSAGVSAGSAPPAKEDEDVGPLPTTMPRRSSTARGRGRKSSADTAPVPGLPKSDDNVVYAVPHSARSSVGDDVLAAWGALGGWRDIERMAVG